MPLVVATRAKQGPNLLSLSRIRYFGACPYGVASRSCCATQASVGDRVTPTWITFRDFSSMRKNAKSGRKNRSVTWRESHAQICAAWCAEKSPTSGLVAGGCELLMYFWMVRLQTRRPSFRSSPESVLLPRVDCLWPSAGSRRWFRRRPWACEKGPLTCASNTGGRAPDASASLVSGWTIRGLGSRFEPAWPADTRRIRSVFVIDWPFHLPLENDELLS